MNDIARVAGVSKGTLYVYFENKERLFTALMHDERSTAEFRCPIPPTTMSRQCSRGSAASFVTFLSAPHVIRAKRSVMAIIERMPEVAADFYRDGPTLCVADLTRYLRSAGPRGGACRSTIASSRRTSSSTLRRPESSSRSSTARSRARRRRRSTARSRAPSRCSSLPISAKAMCARRPAGQACKVCEGPRNRGLRSGRADAPARDPRQILRLS